MAFLHQLRLLLWKNGLAVIRQPLWSLTLIIWPLVIFIIIAVTRHQFPPIVKPPCYVGPRNLPSTGFFPFLQTLMCNTDSHCHNTSRLVDPAATRSSRTTSRQRLSAAKLFQGEEILNFPLAAGQRGAPGALLGFLENITGLHQGGRHHNASFITFNTTLLEDNETLHAMLESVNMLKQAICPMMLPKINNNQTTRPLSFAVVTFCTTNETMLEVSLNTLNQVLIEMMLTRPDELATLAGMAVVVFDQLQNQTSLWESLLAIPQLFHSGSVDEVLDNAENLLTNLQSTLTAIQSKFPETEAPLSAISPIFAISLSVIDYAQDWPGRGVSIPLGELVKVEEDFLSEMVQKVLYGVHIPLDKVIALTLDPDTLNRYVCNNSNNPLWLTAACSTGTVRMLFDWVDSDKAAKQSLLAWSKHVAPRDLSFAKWLLNTLMGEFSPGVPEGPHTPRTRRSVETQPQNIDEELFLWVGEVVLEILHMIPEADKVVQSMLRSGFQSMEIAKLSLETLGGIMDSVLKDASHLKQTYQMLVTDSSKASVWISDVLDSGMEAILMIVASEEATCEDVLSPFEWLLNSETITMEVLRSAICRSDADLQQALLMGLMPLIESAQDFNSTIMGQTDSNVTLPMILSEWQRLYNISQQLLLSVDRLAMELGGAYWMNWMPDNCTHDATGTLQQSVFLFMVKLGGRLERSELWRVVKNYFHMADWVLNYQPGVSTPLNCSVDVYTADVCCHIEKPFNWSQFLTSVTHTLVYLDQHVLVNSLKGTVNLLQHVYSDALNSMVGSFLEHNIHGGEALTHFLINMVHNLQDVVEKISMLPDENITNPNHVGALVSNLFQSSGLSPLLPLLFGDGPVNVSTVLHVATELIKQNQLIVTFNETDPTMPEVEQLIKQFLSLEGNLTMSLSNFMGHSLITYVSYLHPDHVAQIMELIQPFTKQTSAGIVQAIIRAMELLQTVTDAPDGDPTNIILGYIHQLQDFAVSLFRLRRVQKYMLPNGELSASQITDLHILTKEFVDLLSPEGLQRLISAGPDAAQNMVAQKLIDFLPTEAQQEAARLLQDFRILQHYVAKLAAGQDCLKGISEIFTFLNQILDILLTANGNVAIKIAVPNFLHMDQQYEEIACIMFPLLLPPNEAGYLKTFKQAIHFVKLIMATPNITVSGVHNALQQSNLTLEELKNLTSLFGAVDTDDLMARLMDVINSQKCFEPQHSQMVTAQCVLGLVNGVTRFLTQLPGLQNETAILNLIPLIVNNTIKDVGHVDFTNPNAAVIQTLNRTLANVKMGLQVKQLYTPEIMKEIRVLEGLIHLAADPEPFDDIFNSTMTENPMYAQKMYLEMLDWYLKKLENVISHSSLSDLLHPFFKLTQMQVSLQLVQTDFTLFVSRQIEKLLCIFQHPIDSAGVGEISQIAVEMFQRLFQLIKGILDFQNNIPGIDPVCYPTILNAVEFQTKQYLDVTQKWMEQPNFPFLLASMLSSGNASIDPQKCFEPHQNQMVTAQCVLGLVNGVTSFLTQLPGIQNETAILNLIPLIVNNTIEDVGHVDFTNPNAAVIHVLNTTLANVRMGLQHANQSTPEIMKEIRVLESLIQLAADPEPFKNMDSTHAKNPMYAQKLYLEMINWYLERSQSVIRDSLLSDVFHPFLYVTQKQVSLQLAQTEFTLFVSNQIEQLMGNIQHPINGTTVSKIGLSALEMFHHLFQLIKGNLEFQNNIPGLDPLFDLDILHAVEFQMKQYLDITQKWMEQPNFPFLLASMLSTGNASIDPQKCFEPHQNQMVTAQCVLGLVNGVTSFLTQLPGIQNETAILNLIPLIVNNTIEDVGHVDFTNPNAAVIHVLNTTLANVRMGLQHANQSTPEIMKEIRVLESLIQLAADPEPFKNMDSRHAKNPMYAQKLYLEMINWYLERSQSVIRDSLLSDVFHPFLYVTQKQVSLQLAQTEFTLFVSNQIEQLMGNIQHPINGTTVSKIGLSALEMFHHLFQLIKGNLEFQNNIPGLDPLFDLDILHAVEFQMKQYLDITQKWMEQPNFPFLLASMLSTGNASIDPQKCFEPHQNQMVTAQCVLGLVNGVTSFLTQLPGIQNETAILNLIPLIVNNTIEDVGHVDFTNPNAAVIHVLNTTLANVRMGLQHANQSTPEIMKEIRVLESLIQLAADPEPFKNMDSTHANNPMYAQKIYLEMIDWYLEQMHSVIKDSSLSDVLHPFLYVTQKQVSLQLAQTEFTLFVSNQIEQLMGNIQHPISGATVSKIGILAVEMFQRLFQLIKGNLEFQNNIPGLDPLFDPDILHAVEFQMKQYLDITQKWMEQPNFPFLLASMLSSGNASIDPQKCFEPHQNQMVTAQCVLGLVNGVTSFLTQLPGIQNETAILNLIPLVVNNTIEDVGHVDFTNPNAAVIHVLNTTLANVRMGLQHANQSTPEIMKEIRVLESLIQLAADPEPFNTIFNSTLAEHPTYAEKMYLEMINCYLKEMQSVIRDSSLSDVLHPFLYVTQKQVSLQLAQTEFTLFVSNQIEQLMGNIQHPINGATVSKIGILAVEMFQRLFQLIKGNLEFQNNIPGLDPLFDPDILHAVEFQMKQYLDITQKWMEQPNFPFLLASMLSSGNASIDPQKCFEPHQNQMVTAQCVLGLVNGVTSFLTQLPGIQNETAILNLIPLIVNNTIEDVGHVDFTNPNAAVIHVLNTTLANVRMGLQHANQSTPEIMKEIRVLESLIQLAADPEPFKNMDSTHANNPMYAQKIYLEMIDWYLEQMQSVIKDSSLSDVLHPFLYVTQKQVSLQLAQTEFTLFVSNQIEQLMGNIQHPINGTTVSKIGLSALEMFQHLFQLIKGNLEFQNNIPGLDPLFDLDILHAVEFQMKQYLDITQKWMEQPNFPFLLASMLSSGNASIDPQKCFEPHQNQMVTAQCVLGLVNGVTSFLTQLPGIQNETNILNLIPLIVNNTIEDVGHVDFTNPNAAVIHVLNTTLANVRMGLQHANQSTPEIMKEIRVLESLIQLAADPEPFNTIFNSTLAEHPTYAEKMYLEMINWYLKEMQSVIRDSSLSDVLHPFLYVTQKQVSLQLAQTEFTLFVSNQIEQLMGNIQHPINGTTVSKIGNLAVEMFQRLFQLIKGDLELQSSIPGLEPFLNTTILNAVELQIKQNLDMIQKWMNQPAVSLILANMLQWGDPYINVSSPFTDLHHLVQTMFPLFNAEQLTYLSIIRNITHSLSNALQASEQPHGINGDQFTAAIMEAVQNFIKIVTAATQFPLPPHLEQNILDIVNNSLKLIFQQDMNYDSSRIASIHILEGVESLIQQILPDISEYLLPGIKIVTTYFESSLVASGPENWNQLILNEMITVQSLLPLDSPAQVYVSTLINITHFILESGRGNMSLWALFESASADSIPMIIGKMGKLLGMLWPIITGHPGPSLQDFAHLAPILEQVMTGMAGQDTWDKLENILEALLSFLKGTELWDTVSSLVPLFEKIIENLVKNMQAENVMVLSLQGPMVTLMTEIVHTVNSSHCNLTEVSERMQAAIEHTVQAAQQANGTLECSAVLKVWDPVREAAGLSHQAMAVWCTIAVQPVLEAYYESPVVYSNLNMSHMNMGPMTVDATAERIVKTLQSIYQVSLNRSYVAQDLIMAFSSHLSMLTGRPLSAEAQLHWLKQLQKMQMLNSLSSLRMLTDRLLMAAPSLQPYIEAVEKAAHYVLSNYHEIQDSGSSEDVFEEAVMIFLYTANITSDNIFSMMKGNHSLIDEATLTNMTRQAARHLMKMFEEVPMAFHGLEHFLESIDLNLVMEKLAEMVAWLASTEAYAMDLLAQTLPELYHILRPLTSAFYKVCMDVQKHMELFEDFADNLVEMVKQFVSTGGHLGPENYHHGMYGQEMSLRNHTKGVRHKRDAPWMPVMSPMNDLIDFLQIDYHSMFKSLSDRPTPEEIMGTAHSVFANPDLNIVVKGVTSDMRWFLNASREDTIDAAVEMLSFFTLPRVFDMSAVEILQRAADMLPDGFPFAMMIKQISSTLASESQENLSLMENTLETAAELFQINMSDPRFKKKLDQLSAQLCAVEKTDSVHLLMSDVKPGFLCFTLMPSVQFILKSLTMNSSAVMETMFETIIGDPRDYDVNSNWTSMLSQGLSFNISSLNSLDIDVSPQGAVTVGEMLRDEAAFIQDVQQHMDFDPAALRLLMDTPLPDSNLMILTWLVSLRHCNSKSLAEMEEKDAMIYNSFCPMSVDNWYSFSLLMARHLHTEKLIYKMVLSEELQSMVGVMLQVVELIDRMARTILPAISQLQSHLGAIEDLDLIANDEFHQMSRGLRSNMSTKATFVTLSRALCSNGILALFGISKLPLMADDSSPSSPFDQKREDMIKRFKIPRDASPFCMNMYLDMVNTTGGAIAWAFLKPMLMGQILFTPDTPVTRDIMKKSNATLEELANLRKHSREWLDSSHYILKSAEILSYTLPMLQNSLGNSFVKNFIEMQTDINVDTMKETLSNFSNMTLLLEKNKQILTQITTLSTLMVNLSSCIKFDRYRGYNSAEQLDADAQELAKNRDLYASVIFKLPKDSNSSRKRREATSSLPPKVSYTIRMHMDNVMRTDRVRNPFFIRATHISARMTMRYNRGFVYMQENIDRAIIAAHAGQTVAEPAVQLQPFPYPCHHRDEYLESISYVFPLMLMLAWVLFVADFVKRLVYERELRLHEYMKMMGVNPLSHFFAWFIECALYLFLTIFILTLVLKYGSILPNSDGFLLFLYLCNYGLSILAFSYLVSSIFDKTFIAALSGSLLYILFFFPFIVVMAVETTLTFTQKSILSLFSPTCFSYASQYISRYEAQREGIQWSNIYKSPIAGDEASFGWLCWLMLIDSILYFLIGAYIRMVLPGKYGIPAPWYFPFKASFWAELCCCAKSDNKTSRGLLFTNIMQKNPSVFSDDKGKGQSALSSQDGEDFSHLPVGVTLHSLSKLYGDRVAIQNLNVSFYEGHVTSLLGHNGAGKTTTMSLLTGLFAPTSGTIEVYGRDMQTHTDDVRKELGVCMQYDVLFDHMTTKEHLLLYGQIKAPQWSKGELREQIRTILEETGMYAHRHKRVGTLSGGMKRKLSISIAFIGGSRLVVLDEPTTGVDPCSRRSIWDIIIQYKKHRTIIMSTHHLDEAEVLSDRITFLERGGLKCCGSPFHLKDKLGQGYKLTLTKKMQNQEKQIDNAELKSFIQAHVPEARLKEAQGGDLVYSLPPFSSSNASSYRSLLTALDSNLDALQLGGYGVSDTTLEEVFLQLAQDDREPWDDDTLPSVSEKVSDTGSMDSFPSDSGSISSFNDNIKLTGSTMVRGMALAWQQLIALLTKRFHHCRRDWKGLISQILLPVLFMMAAMGLGSIKSDLQHYPELELSPALYRYEPSYSFFSNSNPNSEQLIDTMLSSPGIDNECLNNPNNPVCSRNTSPWRSSGNSSKAFRSCKCTRKEQICESDNYQPPHRGIPSSQIVYNLSGINVENYLVSTANDFIRNRYGGFAFGMPLPRDLKMDIQTVPKNRTLSKVWFNPEGHHTMPAYLNSINNFILRANLPADKDPRKYAISVSSHPYFGRADDEDTILQGMLQILVAMCVMTGYSITTASFVIYVVSEHHTGSKRLQHIAGISESFYWVVNFCFDMVMYMIPVALTVAVVAAFQVPAFTYRQNLGAVTLLLVLFGFSTFPWMYLLSGIFKDAEMAFITYVCINLFLSVNTIMSTSILYFLSQLSTINPEIVLAVFHRMCNAFLIFPQFTFGHGLMQLARKNAEVQLLSGYGVDAYINPFTMEGLGWLFISSFIQGVVLFSLRLLLNKFIARKVRRLICGRKTVPYVSHEEVDEDVATEHQRVASGAAGSDILQVNQLTKVYQSFSKKVQAVKRVSVGIPAGECFGLLGVNGAGKTTTFKMLTGDVSPTAGTAQIRDQDGRLVDIMACRNQGINIGYCPQVDALDNLLTGEEHLYFYARIRGISKREIDRVVRYLLKRLELNYHRNITTEGYSCGTRRKLSTALALIGNPQILLLDEPSSGMDPRTKRHLWKIISEEVKGKCAVVLTSHSMEECEALCSRLAIMVKGQFRCLGSLQHIKNRFGSGFTVKMYLAEASCDAEAITGFMQRRFPSTYLKDQHSNMVEFHVPVAPGGVADIFDQLESNKSALRIKHFSVSQTTLDEVFINFAMENTDNMENISINNEDGSDSDSMSSISAAAT